jgi:hypothetical protein
MQFAFTEEQKLPEARDAGDGGYSATRSARPT